MQILTWIYDSLLQNKTFDLVNINLWDRNYIQMVFICDQFNEIKVFVMSNETCFEENCTKIQWYIKLSF